MGKQSFSFKEAAAEMARGKAGLLPELDFSGASVLLLDTFLDSRWPEGLGREDEEWTPEKEGLQRLVVGYGAYLGEVLRRKIGGKWVAESGATLEWYIELPKEKGQVVVIDKAFKRFKNGPVDALFPFFLHAREQVGAKPYTASDAPLFVAQDAFWKSVGRPKHALPLYEMALKLDPELASAKNGRAAAVADRAL
jgi:hypothetical protein